jgi:hypothetical protein
MLSLTRFQLVLLAVMVVPFAIWLLAGGVWIHTERPFQGDAQPTTITSLQGEKAEVFAGIRNTSDYEAHPFLISRSSFGPPYYLKVVVVSDSPVYTTIETIDTKIARSDGHITSIDVPTPPEPLEFHEIGLHGRNVYEAISTLELPLDYELDSDSALDVLIRLRVKGEPTVSKTLRINAVRLPAQRSLQSFWQGIFPHLNG